MPDEPLLPAVPATSPANCFDLTHFVLTNQVRRVMDLCRILQDTRTLGMLVGLPGVGKTWAAQYAAENQPQPELFTASPVLYTSVDVENSPRTLLTNLLNCLGPDYRAPVPDMTKLACCWIHRRQVELIILDKADELDPTSWKIVQDIHDRTRCAFLFIGPPDLSLKLRRLPELLNRVGLTIELPLLSFDELVEFLYQWQKTRWNSHQARVATFTIFPDRTPEDIAMVKDIYRVTMGNLRRACYVVQEAERIAKVNGQCYVDPPVMKATIRLLLGESN